MKHDIWFEITPFNHVRSKDGGCPQCDKETAVGNFRRKGEKKFTEWFNRERADRLEMGSPFHGMTEEMAFRCKVHGTVSRHKPTFLMNSGGFGCPDCARASQRNRAMLQDETVRREIEDLLPDHIRFLGLAWDDVKCQNLMQIECERHGIQLVTKGYLKRSSHKCPQCGNESTGFAGYRLARLVEMGERGGTATIGVMAVEVYGITSLKVGVTTRSLQERYLWHLKTIFFAVEMSERDTYVLENRIHRRFAKRHDLRILKAGMRLGKRWGGDTECYWMDQKDRIIGFINEFIDNAEGINYREELNRFFIPDFFPRDVSRKKDETNRPVPVVGVDPETSKVVVDFSSISDATKAGYRNVSQVISANHGRQFAGGLRWFKKEGFNQNDIPALEPPCWGRPVRCLETGQIYRSATEAEKDLREQGIPISSSHIASVCKGKRRVAGGRTWEYVDRGKRRNPSDGEDGPR